MIMLGMNLWYRPEGFVWIGFKYKLIDLLVWAYFPQMF